MTLPQGRAGKATAIAMTVLALALVWFAVISPLVGWYQTRAAMLVQQTAIAARMTALGREIPQLRAAVKAAGPQMAGAEMLLPGGSDAIAGANLQSALQNLAQQAGTSLDSNEMMPAQQAGALRQISMQVSVTANWPVLIAFLDAISTAKPRMVVGGLGIQAAAQALGNAAPPVQASFSVTGFRAGPP